MKKISFLVASIIFTVASYGQQIASATAIASANVVVPISITKAGDMNFGNMASGATTGTIIMSPAGVRFASGGVSLPATTGSPSGASFDITGAVGYTYSISLPTTPTTIDDGHGHTMTVNAFTSTPNATGTLTGGTQTLYVGATLTLSAGQATGTYTSATSFTVMVQYN